MGYFTYILKNNESDKFYIGSTSDLDKRLQRHNNGYVKSTKWGAPNWVIVYFEGFTTRKEAMSREQQIKSMKSRKYIKSLIG